MMVSLHRHHPLDIDDITIGEGETVISARTRASSVTVVSTTKTKGRVSRRMNDGRVDSDGEGPIGMPEWMMARGAKERGHK